MPCASYHIPYTLYHISYIPHTLYIVIYYLPYPQAEADLQTSAEELQDVRCVTGTGGAFAALRNDGRVVTWGHLHFGADSSAAPGSH